MSTENRNLAATLYHLAATRTIDFLIDQREEEVSSPGATSRHAPEQRRPNQQSDKRAAGGRA